MTETIPVVEMRNIKKHFGGVQALRGVDLVLHHNEVLGLVGETGEVADKIKKVIRDDGGKLSEEKRRDIEKELGDVLWYLANLATELNLSLDEIALKNLEKLQDRQDRGVLRGSGDNR